MALLVHLRVLTVRRLGVAAAVSTGADMYVAVWGRILSHALRQAWTLRAILRRRVVVGGRRLVPDGWQLRVGRALSWDTDCLSHLSVNRGFAGRTALMLTLLCISSVALVVSLALSLLLLLLRLPFFADLFELYIVVKSA
jgi:hypothetical protein